MSVNQSTTNHILTGGCSLALDQGWYYDLVLQVLGCNLQKINHRVISYIICWYIPSVNPPNTIPSIISHHHSLIWKILIPLHYSVFSIILLLPVTVNKITMIVGCKAFKLLITEFGCWWQLHTESKLASAKKIC